MTAYAVAWTICMVVACLFLVALVVFVEAREHRAHGRARRQLDELEEPQKPRIPEQRQPTASAAAIVTIGDPASYDAFLAELIVTPHVEDVLS